MKVFVSYSRSDERAVLPILNQLRSEGFEFWIDQEAIEGAAYWRKEIVDAICASPVILFFASSRSFSSKSVARELALAGDESKPIIPVFLERCKTPSEFRYQIAGLQHIELIADHSRGMRSLTAALRGFVDPVTFTSGQSCKPSGMRLSPAIRWGAFAGVAVCLFFSLVFFRDRLIAVVSATNQKRFVDAGPTMPSPLSVRFKSSAETSTLTTTRGGAILNPKYHAKFGIPLFFVVDKDGGTLADEVGTPLASAPIGKVWVGVSGSRKGGRILVGEHDSFTGQVTPIGWMSETDLIEGFYPVTVGILAQKGLAQFSTESERGITPVDSCFARVLIKPEANIPVAASPGGPPASPTFQSPAFRFPWYYVYGAEKLDATVYYLLGNQSMLNDTEADNFGDVVAPKQRLIGWVDSRFLHLLASNLVLEYNTDRSALLKRCGGDIRGNGGPACKPAAIFRKPDEASEQIGVEALGMYQEIPDGGGVVTAAPDPLGLPPEIPRLHVITREHDWFEVATFASLHASLFASRIDGVKLTNAGYMKGYARLRQFQHEYPTFRLRALVTFADVSNLHANLSKMAWSIDHSLKEGAGGNSRILIAEALVKAVHVLEGTEDQIADPLMLREKANDLIADVEQKAELQIRQLSPALESLPTVGNDADHALFARSAKDVINMAQLQFAGLIQSLHRKAKCLERITQGQVVPEDFNQIDIWQDQRTRPWIYCHPASQEQFVYLPIQFLP